jgi:hypothetical protein
MNKILLSLALMAASASAQAELSADDMKASCEARAMWTVLNQAIRTGYNQPGLNQYKISIQHIESMVDASDSTRSIVIVTANENQDYILVPRQYYFSCKDGKIVE